MATSSMSALAARQIGAGSRRARVASSVTVPASRAAFDFARRGAASAPSRPATAGKTTGFDGLRRENAIDALAAPRPSGLRAAARAAAAAGPIGPRTITTAVFERFTERAIKAVLLAQQEAKAMRRTECGPEQLLIGLIEESGSTEGYLGTRLTAASVREAAASLGGPVPGEAGPAEIPFSAGAKRLFELAVEDSRRLGMNYVAPEHLAVALAQVEGGITHRILEALDVPRETLRAQAAARLDADQDNQRATGRGNTAGSRGAAASRQGAGSHPGAGTSTSGDRAGAGGAAPSILADFCRDLTELARSGKLDPVMGRESEVARTIQILARRTKNNPILLGEPGVGKTAIAEGIALLVASGRAPSFLENKRVLALDLAQLLAGTKERGELEARVTGLVAEMKAAKDVCLFIDEIHTLVGSGSSSRPGGGGLDVANLLKPALARGELQCIGATTLAEFRACIAEDAALERRFQPVHVSEPTEPQAVAILTGLAARYEVHHGVRYSSEALVACVRLSARYIADRQLPDKAIDLMDEAGSRAKVAQFAAVRAAKRVVALRADVARLADAVTTARAAGLAGEVAALKLQSADMEALLARSSQEVLDDKASAERMLIGVEDIAAVASEWSGVPLRALSEADTQKLANLEGALGDAVLGQAEAVAAVSRALKRARCGLADPRRPLAAMLFSGPTGVGKTELTKALARQYFGSEEAMIRLDMSEFMERHTVAKLIGSPPGYVGFGEGGLLTEAVRKRPFTVVLLDEVEKAHPDVFNLMLQVLEDGRLTDSQGRVVSFKNTLIVMTSNLGSSGIQKGGSGLGFQLESEDPAAGRYTHIRSLVMEELKGYFRPEFLNRLDEVVVFKPLERPEVAKIATLMLRDMHARLAERGMSFDVTEAFRAHLLAEGYDVAYGARPLRRAIMRLVEDKLAEEILNGRLMDNQHALLDYDGTEVKISTMPRVILA